MITGQLTVVDDDESDATGLTLSATDLGCIVESLTDTDHTELAERIQAAIDGSPID